jgi:hypothetical protein
MEAGNFNFPRIDRLEDSRQQTDPDSVAQLGIFKAKIANLAQHGPAVGVAMRIPAGGKGIHKNKGRVQLNGTAPGHERELHRRQLTCQHNARSASQKTGRLSSCAASARSAFQNAGGYGLPSASLHGRSFSSTGAGPCPRVHLFSIESQSSKFTSSQRLTTSRPSLTGRRPLSRTGEYVRPLPLSTGKFRFLELLPDPAVICHKFFITSTLPAKQIQSGPNR